MRLTSFMTKDFPTKLSTPTFTPYNSSATIRSVFIPTRRLYFRFPKEVSHSLRDGYPRLLRLHSSVTLTFKWP